MTRKSGLRPSLLDIEPNFEIVSSLTGALGCHGQVQLEQSIRFGRCFLAITAWILLQFGLLGIVQQRVAVRLVEGHQGGRESRE